MQIRLLNSAAIFLLFAGISEAQSGTATQVYTVPDGLAFTVDGQRFSAAMTAFWPTSTKHVLTADQFEFGGLNVKSRYAFQGWQYSGGQIPGGATITVTADPTLKAFYALYSVEHALDLVFNTCTGTAECPIPGTLYVNDVAYTQDAEIFLAAGSTVKLMAVPAAGFVFTGWGPGDNQTPQGYFSSVNLIAPSVVRPIFSPAKKVTLTTVPPELGLYADRALVATPSTFDWAFNTTHVVGAPNPVADKYGHWWSFQSWNDGGALNHTISIPSGGPTITLTATFVPATVTVFKTNPANLAVKIDGRDNWPNYFFPWAAGEVHRIEAAAQQSDDRGHIWNFSSWSNGGARVQDYTVPPADDSGLAVVLTANYSPVGHLVVTSAVAGLSIKVDGADCGTPCDLQRPVGTVVKLSAPASLPLADNARADFDGWPGSGSFSGDWTVTLGAEPVMPNLTYHTMNRLIATSNPADGAAWRVDPASPDGFYDAQTTVKVAVTAQPGFKFRKWSGDAAGTAPFASVSMNTPRLVEADFDRVPYIAPAGIANAAGTTPVAAVAPGSIVSIFGASFGQDVIVGPTGPLAQALGCITVRIGDRMLPLFFVSPSQINVQMPDDVQPSDQRVVVSCQGAPDVQAMVTIARNGPGLFQDANANGLVVHEDGSAVNAASPAKRGELLTIYGTGFGPTDRPRPFGFPLPADPVYSIVDGVTVNVDGAAIGAEKAMGVAGRIGVDGAQFRLPDGTASGSVKVKLTVNGVDSNTVVAPVE